MSYDVQSLESQIRAILSAPGVDLSTISAKRVRKQLMEDDPELTAEVVRENKEEIDGLISQVFEEISGPGQDDDDEEGSVKSNKRKKKGGDDDDGASRPAKKKAKNGQEKSDEKLARKLSNEINGRATRGAVKNRSNGAAKKARNKKSSATVGSDDDDDGEGAGKKKRGGGGGGFKKEYVLRYAIAEWFVGSTSNFHRLNLVSLCQPSCRLRSYRDHKW